MPCADCKFWSRDKETEKRAGSLVVNHCRRAPMWWDATEWTDEEDPECEWDNLRRLLPEHEGTKMFVQDGSDFVVYLYTEADFGCVHFEHQ